MKRGPSKGYIKELADRLINLEHQMGGNAPSQNYDFSNVSDQVLAEAQAQTQLSRKRTHSMSENFTESYSRPNWSGQDRGTHPTSASDLWMLTSEDSVPNGTTTNSNRRVSFGEMTLAGSLITGSNETTIKA
jgi:hypothetical protein